MTKIPRSQRDAQRISDEMRTRRTRRCGCRTNLRKRWEGNRHEQSHWQSLNSSTCRQLSCFSGMSGRHIGGPCWSHMYTAALAERRASEQCRDLGWCPSAAMNASSSQLNVSLLAENPPRQMDGAAMDYFLIELVHTLRASSAVATARARQTERTMAEAGLIPPAPLAPLKGDRERKIERDSLNSAAASPRESAGSTLASVLSRSAASKANEGLDEDEEAVRKRLEAIGAHVGSNITER